MRHTAIACALALFVARLAVAQEWTEYQSARDGFQALFPSPPRVAETCLSAPNLSGVGYWKRDGSELRYRTLYTHEIHGLREAQVPAHAPLP